MNKKYFPFLAFFLLIGAPFIFELLSAGQTTQKKKMNAHLQSVYSKSVFKTIDKREIHLKNIKAPIVILNFWASWCIPCLQDVLGCEIVSRRQAFILQFNLMS